MNRPFVCSVCNYYLSYTFPMRGARSAQPVQSSSGVRIVVVERSPSVSIHIGPRSDW